MKVWILQVGGYGAKVHTHLLHSSMVQDPQRQPSLLVSPYVK